MPELKRGARLQQQLVSDDASCGERLAAPQGEMSGSIFPLTAATRLSEHPRPMKGHRNRGDAMVTALIVLFAAVVLVASMLS